MHLALLHDLRQLRPRSLKRLLGFLHLKFLHRNHLIHNEHGIAVVTQIVHVEGPLPHPPPFLEISLLPVKQRLLLLQLLVQTHLCPDDAKVSFQFAVE